MKSLVRLMAIAAFLLLVAAPAMYAQAPAIESSTLPADTAIDVGGTILQPGAYIIKVVSPVADRNKVVVTTVDGEVVATLLTVPHALEPGEKYPDTAFVFYPAANGAPRALRTWFPANRPSGGGHDIVYEESRAKQLARLTNENVVSYRGEQTAELEVVTPEEKIETYVAPAPEPIPTPEPVTTTPMTSAAPLEETNAAQDNATEMPQTAGEVPLVALLGLLSLGGAVLVRRARRA